MAIVQSKKRGEVGGWWILLWHGKLGTWVQLKKKNYRSLMTFSNADFRTEKIPTFFIIIVLLCIQIWISCSTPPVDKKVGENYWLFSDFKLYPIEFQKYYKQLIFSCTCFFTYFKCRVFFNLAAFSIHANANKKYLMSCTSQKLTQKNFLSLISTWYEGWKKLLTSQSLQSLD